MVGDAPQPLDGSAPDSTTLALPASDAALERPQQQLHHDATNNNHLSPSTSSTPARPADASQDHASNAPTSALMPGSAPQRPASDSSNQSTDAEQNFTGAGTSRPSWTHTSSRPPASDGPAPPSGDPPAETATDGYHSPSRPALKLPKRRHGHADPPPLSLHHHHPHHHHHHHHHLHAHPHAPNTSSGIEDSDGGCSADDATAALPEPVSKISKKQRLHWSAELHTRFMSAVHHLGIDAAVPKNILQLMNVEGMTRDNVASHLQKYRLHLKRLAGVGPNDPIPPHLIPQVQAEAMRLHKAKQQQEAFQLRMLQEHRARNDRARNDSAGGQPLSPAAAATQHAQHPLALQGAASPASPRHATGGQSAPQQGAGAGGLPKSLFPPLVINHDAAAQQPPFHPFAQPSLGGGAPAAAKKAAPAAAAAATGQEQHAAALAANPAAAAAAAMHGLMPQASASMDAVQLGYTLGLMQGASHQWKAPQQFSGHMVAPPHPSLVHLAPHLQAPLFDPTAAAAAAMASTLQQQHQLQQHQQQHQQQQPEVSGALNLASLAALQQMYCPLPAGPYGTTFVTVQPPGGPMISQGDGSMFGLQPGAMWPMRPVFPQQGPFHPPC